MSFRQRQFLNLLALAIVPLVFALGTALPITQNFVLQRTREQLEIVADLKTQAVDEWLNRGDEVVQFVSERVAHEIEISEISTNATASEEISSAETNLRRLLQSAIASFTEVNEISLLDPTTGRVLLSTDLSLEGRDRSNENYFQQSQIETFISPVVYSVGREAPVLTIASPVYDANNRLVAIVATEMNLNNLESALANRSGLGETGRAYLVEGYGFYVTLSPESNTSPLLRIAESTGVQRVLAGQNGYDRYLDPSGVSVFGVYRWLPQVNLGLLVEIDAAELTSQYTSIWFIVVLAELLLLLVVIFIARALAARLVAPLKRMAKTARAVQFGDIQQRTAIDGPIEIQQLASAFNDMADSLQQSQENLESLVQQRTQELSDTNNRLRQEIIEREQAQEEAIENEKKYRQLIEVAQEGIWSLMPQPKRH